MDDWDDAVAFARALPGVEMASFYGDMVPKLNGKAILSPGREADSFHLPVSHADKAMLMETDPDTFWQTPHYEGWPGVLVRYGRERERVERWILRRWWDVAKKAQRVAAGMEERP
ncbi:hypothetical protein AB2M62_10660 [Sphingomonas sp. MMS12-HWE2-04]|uniref:hypothetical protein n=1 Tax=Sphingomonas sp. MMS12-HWE2-04 TaxID=3234199 RepID=UPI00384EF798